jgi:uncharacterized protein YdhG (YjbR/CyaY superfamily)
VLRLGLDPVGIDLGCVRVSRVKAKGDPAVDEYIASLPGDRRATIEALHQLIRRVAPELAPAMWKNIIGYGSYRYRYASGKEGEWFLVGLANQKRYVSLYICAVVDGAYLAEANADRLGKVSVGKSCIRFTKLDHLDLDVVTELVETSVREVAAGNFGV